MSEVERTVKLNMLTELISCAVSSPLVIYLFTVLPWNDKEAQDSNRGRNSNLYTPNIGREVSKLLPQSHDQSCILREWKCVVL